MSHPSKRRHHTVPRFYLSRFANDKTQVTRVALPGHRRHLLSVNNAAVVTDFYLVELEDGTWADTVEDALAALEADAARAFRTVVDTQARPIPPEARKAIAAWVSAQHLRTPYMRKMLDVASDTAVKTMIEHGGRRLIRQLLENHKSRPATDAEVDQVMEAASRFDTYRIRQHQNEHIRLVSVLLDRAATVFHQCGWSIIRFTRKSLATSDTPVVLLPIEGADERTPLGLASNSGVFVPLDRRVALVTGEHGEQDELLPGTTKAARVLNQHTAWNAYRCLFHHPDDDPLAGLEIPNPEEPEIKRRWWILPSPSSCVAPRRAAEDPQHDQRAWVRTRSRWRPSSGTAEPRGIPLPPNIGSSPVKQRLNQQSEGTG